MSEDNITTTPVMNLINFRLLYLVQTAQVL